MSTEDTDAGPQACMACRGTGSVVSNLGGSPNPVPCPWCDGTGTQLPEHDAQARWKQDPEPGGPGGSGAAA
jgi:DnaJ-class molecular chaperone